MSFTNHQLVIAVSSRALFDLEHENRIFETDGIAAYRTYQEAHREEPLAPGVAFPFRLVDRLPLDPWDRPLDLLFI